MRCSRGPVETVFGNLGEKRSNTCAMVALVPEAVEADRSLIWDRLVLRENTVLVSGWPEMCCRLCVAVVAQSACRY